MLSDYWDEPVEHSATDLTTLGVWIETDLPLDQGERVMLALIPPNWTDPLVTEATVTRTRLARRRQDSVASGMGLRFTGLTPSVRAELSRALRGTPPPVPECVRNSGFRSSRY